MPYTAKTAHATKDKTDYKKGEQVPMRALLVRERTIIGSL
jgi:hypothetical protein